MRLTSATVIFLGVLQSVLSIIPEVPPGVFVLKMLP